MEKSGGKEEVEDKDDKVGNGIDKNRDEGKSEKKKYNR